MTKAEQFVKDLEAYNKAFEEIKSSEPKSPRLEFGSHPHSGEPAYIFKVDRFGNLDIIFCCQTKAFASFPANEAVKIGKWLLETFSTEAE